MELMSSKCQLTIELLDDGVEVPFLFNAPLFQINFPPDFIQVYLAPFAAVTPRLEQAAPVLTAAVLLGLLK